MVLGVDLVVTVASGGAEDGSPTWVTPATDISCLLNGDFVEALTSVRADTTTRCGAFTTSRGLRTSARISFPIDIPDSGTPVFGRTINTYWQFVIKYVSSGTGVTYNTVLTSNSLSGPRDARSVQTVEFEIQAIPS